MIARGMRAKRRHACSYNTASHVSAHLRFRPCKYAALRTSMSRGVHSGMLAMRRSGERRASQPGCARGGCTVRYLTFALLLHLIMCCFLECWQHTATAVVSVASACQCACACLPARSTHSSLITNAQRRPCQHPRLSCRLPSSAAKSFDPTGIH